MKRLSLYFIFFMTGLFIISCEKEPLPTPELEETSGVFICNEGNFTFGNASLSLYDPKTEIIRNEIFFNINQFPIGDVLHSMNQQDSFAYLVVNNSSKIHVLNKNSLEFKKTITGFTSPRFIHFISPTKAYVSDLYDSRMSIINLQNHEISGSINLRHSSEEIISKDNFVYTTAWTHDSLVLKVNSTTDELVDSLIVGYQPNSLAFDKDGNFWVLSDGGNISTPKTEHPTLVKIDPESMQVMKKYTFSNINSSPFGLCFNNSRDSLFYIQRGNAENGVYAMNIHDSGLPQAPFIMEDENNFSSVAVDPNSSDIYVANASDNISNGSVFRVSATGIPIDTFQVGIIPGEIIFSKQ